MLASSIDTLRNPFDELLPTREKKDLLRFMTCGSVDDGKSTLIGRLLYDTKLLPDDQLATLRTDSTRHCSTEKDMDFALLVDGLEAEREQGITIDVAYRYFATAKRKFIVADTPGHEQYTRNMATGASTADLAVVLIDARKGVLTQTRRHSFLASLLGVRHIVLAVNKIDLVGYSKDVFDAIVADYRAFAGDLRFESITAIPISARYGENVVVRGENLKWYGGPTFVEHLEEIEIARSVAEQPFRMPVQWVNRPNLDFRGFCGTVTGGTIACGDVVAVASSGRSSRISRIVTFDGDLDRAVAGQSITLVLADEIDISRGDLLSAEIDRPMVADQFSAQLIWMGDEALIPGRTYIFKTGAKSVLGTVTEIKYRTDVDSFARIATKQLDLNDVGAVNISLHEAIAADPYDESRETGSFIVIDRISNQTMGAGTINFALRRAQNVHRQAVDVHKDARASALGQRPVVIWFTGLSGAGKSTIANLVEKRLFALGRHTYFLDGDNVRQGINRDLGFTEADRVENVRRVAEIAKLFVDAGMIVLASFISPYRSDRQMARELLEPDEFVEVFVDVPLEVAEGRDPKGLYRKARAGKLANLTGIDSPYEAPEAAEIHLAADAHSAEDLADRVVAYLRDRGHLG